MPQGLADPRPDERDLQLDLLALRQARAHQRAQHLERWAIPRSDFPLDKPGYFRWRKSLHARQGQRARELLAGAVDEATRERVAQLVAKAAPKGDAEGQALEDAACLVFLEQEIAGFQPRKGAGCSVCSETGFKGRVAVYEVMELKEREKRDGPPKLTCRTIKLSWSIEPP